MVSYGLCIFAVTSEDRELAALLASLAGSDSDAASDQGPSSQQAGILLSQLEEQDSILSASQQPSVPSSQHQEDSSDDDGAELSQLHEPSQSSDSGSESPEAGPSQLPR